MNKQIHKNREEKSEVNKPSNPTLTAAGSSKH